MNVLLCGGGTVGHVNPAVAIGEAILKLNPDNRIAFVSRLGGAEQQIIKKRGYKIYEIEIHGFKRKICLENIKNAAVALSSLKIAKKIIKDFMPDAVVGTGGYVCWPLLTAAARLKIPTFIHESNAVAGLVTRLCAPKATRVFLNCKDAEKDLKRKDNILVVGNPLLKDFLEENKISARRKLGLTSRDLFILSVGGSGGADVMNKTIIEFMKSYSSLINRIKHTHACGRAYFEKIKESDGELVRGKGGCIIVPYIENMSTMLNAADIVISRCGASTLTEISATKTAAVLIPSPSVTDNHQLKNAKFFEERGAGIVIEEKDLTAKALIDATREILDNAPKKQRMEYRTGLLYNDGADTVIAKEIVRYASCVLP